MDDITKSATVADRLRNLAEQPGEFPGQVIDGFAYPPGAVDGMAFLDWLADDEPRPDAAEARRLLETGKAVQSLAEAETLAARLQQLRGDEYLVAFQEALTMTPEARDVPVEPASSAANHLLLETKDPAHFKIGLILATLLNADLSDEAMAVIDMTLDEPEFLPLALRARFRAFDDEGYDLLLERSELVSAWGAVFVTDMLLLISAYGDEIAAHIDVLYWIDELQRVCPGYMYYVARQIDLGNVAELVFAANLDTQARIDPDHAALDLGDLTDCCGLLRAVLTKCDATTDKLRGTGLLDGLEIVLRRGTRGPITAEVLDLAALTDLMTATTLLGRNKLGEGAALSGLNRAERRRIRALAGTILKRDDARETIEKALDRWQGWPRTAALAAHVGRIFNIDASVTLQKLLARGVLFEELVVAVLATGDEALIDEMLALFAAQPGRIEVATVYGTHPGACARPEETQTAELLRTLWSGLEAERIVAKAPDLIARSIQANGAFLRFCAVSIAAGAEPAARPAVVEAALHRCVEVEPLQRIRDLARMAVGLADRLV